MNKSIPKNVRWAANGKGTAELLYSKTQQVDFIGTADIVAIATNFLNLAKNKTVLFPQAEHSRQTIQLLLRDNINAKNLIVYKNESKKQITIPKCDALVFPVR